MSFDPTKLTQKLVSFLMYSIAVRNVEEYSLCNVSSLHMFARETFFLTILTHDVGN